MNKRGQSIIEYALIAIVVILGIVIMGPYVLRSINAHYKLWDDGVQDSFEEHLTQAPLGDVPLINSNCTCTATSSCGSLTSYCGANQMETDYTCNPLGCHAATACIDNPCCCTAAPMECGTSPIPESGIPVGSPCGTSYLLPGTTCTTTPPSPYPSGAICVPAPKDDPSNCYFGYKIWGNECGSSISDQCIVEPTCPQPACLGVPSPGATQCTSVAPLNGTPLLQNYGVTYVANAAACATPCQYYCDATKGYVINPTGSACMPAPYFYICCTTAAHDQNTATFTFADGTSTTLYDSSAKFLSIPTSAILNLTYYNSSVLGGQYIFSPVYSGAVLTGWQFTRGWGCGVAPYINNISPNETIINAADCGKKAFSPTNDECIMVWGGGSMICPKPPYCPDC